MLFDYKIEVRYDARILSDHVFVNLPSLALDYAKRNKQLLPRGTRIIGLILAKSRGSERSAREVS